jgi:DNA polymerase-1
MRGYSERNAINAPIQGSAADMIKVAMIKIQDWLKEKELKTRMVLQVHDELVFETPEEELELILNEIPEMMKEAIKLDVPIEVEADKGANWLEAH